MHSIHPSPAVAKIGRCLPPGLSERVQQRSYDKTTQNVGFPLKFPPRDGTDLLLHLFSVVVGVVRRRQCTTDTPDPPPGWIVLHVVSRVSRNFTTVPSSGHEDHGKDYLPSVSRHFATLGTHRSPSNNFLVARRAATPLVCITHARFSRVRSRFAFTHAWMDGWSNSRNGKTKKLDARGDGRMHRYYVLRTTKGGDTKDVHFARSIDFV